MTTNYDLKVDVKSSYIDESFIREIKEFMGEEGDDTVRELVEIYLTKTPTTITKISDDIQSGDMNALKMDVHSLKGSSSSIGVTGFATVCKQIENLIELGRNEEIDGKFNDLINVYKIVENELHNWL